MTGLAAFIIYVAHGAQHGQYGTPVLAMRQKFEITREVDPDPPLTPDSPPRLSDASRTSSTLRERLDHRTNDEKNPDPSVTPPVELSNNSGSGTLNISGPSRTPTPYSEGAQPELSDPRFTYRNLVALKSKQKDPLGAGGFGEVYSLGEPVKDSGEGSALGTMDQYAAKFITFNRKGLDKSRIRHNLRQTMREMNIMMHMNHPNVMGLKAICPPLRNDKEFQKNGIALVMDKMSGSMTDKIMIREEPLTLAEVCDYSYQILCGISYLQSMNIMHRDLKPGNILVDESNGTCTLKICDLGLSRYWNPEYDSTQKTRPRALSTGLVQTAVWRGPDVANSMMTQNPTYDLKCDVFSVGIIMAEMLAVGESQSEPPRFTYTTRACLDPNDHKGLLRFYNEELPSGGSGIRQRMGNLKKRAMNITNWIQHYECNPDADVENPDFKALVKIIACMLNTDKKRRLSLQNALKNVHDLRNKLNDKPIDHGHHGSLIRRFEQTSKRWGIDNQDKKPAG